MKKSKILLLFKCFIIISSLVNILLIIIFLKSYSINEKKFSNYGTIKSLKKQNDKTIVLIKSNYNVIGYIKSDKNLHVGDIIEFSYVLKDVSKNTIPNGFNYKSYLKSINVYGVLNILKYKKMGSKKTYFLRKNINKLIDRKKSKTYLKTFIMGDRSLIDYDMKNVYSSNGVLHILCVSGFHVIFLLELVKTLLRKIKAHKTIVTICISFVSVIYLYLSSFSFVLLRAFLFYFFNYYNEKNGLNISKNLIFILTLNICLFNRPFLIFNNGFWYTFILSYFLMKFKFRIKNGLLSTFCVSLIAFFISVPLNLYLNYCINLLTIIINPFLLVIACYIMFPICFLAIFFNVFDFILSKISLFFELINISISKINCMTIVFHKISVFTLVFMYMLLFFIFYKKSFKLAIFYILFLILLKYSIYLDTDNYIYFVDVQQGDMSVLVLYKNVIIIDTGGIENNKYLSKNIKSFLYSIGITKIENLIISHGDYDHMGEAINLVNNFKVEKVIFNCGPYNDLEKELIKVLDEKKIKYYLCIKELDIDNNKLYFLQTKEYDTENDNSNVIYTEINGYKFMFMGDASIATEKEILDKYNLPDVDVLKVGHHGSKTSSGKNFIDEINPKYSVISVGKNNRYGHPNKEVLNNLKNTKIYRTDQDGSIMFKIKNKKLKIETCSP